MGKNQSKIGKFLAFFQQVILPAKITQLFIQTILKWQRDECIEKGAALAYYSLFSLFPILLVMLSVLGMILGPDSNYYLQLIELARNILPAEPFKMVQETLLSLNRSSFGAGILGFGLLILTASRIFDALNRSVDKIWLVHKKVPKDSGIKHHAFQFVKDKIMAFLLVLSTVFVFLSSMLSNLAIKIIMTIINRFEQSISWIELDNLMLIRGLQASISYLLTTWIIVMLFKVLPSTHLKWRDIIPGSLFTAATLMGLQSAISSGIIRIGENFKAYGVIGNVMMLLLWIYLIFQIFFIGCEFTYMFTYLFGSRCNEERPSS